MGSDLLQKAPLAHPAVNRVMVGGPDLLTLANHCGTSTNVFPNANPSLGYASRRGMFPCHLFSPNFQQVRTTFTICEPKHLLYHQQLKRYLLFIGAEMKML